MSEAKPVGYWTQQVVRRHRTWRRRASAWAETALERCYPVLSVVIALATWPVLIALVAWAALSQKGDAQ